MYETQIFTPQAQWSVQQIFPILAKLKISITASSEELCDNFLIKNQDLEFLFSSN